MEMKAVWNKEIQNEKNHTLAFVKQMLAQKNDELEIVASNLYRLFVNDNFVGYGPARSAHGYSRIDKYDLSKYAGEKIQITVEVFASNINTYYILDEPPFFAGQIARNGEVVFKTEDFKSFLITDRVTKVQRFSFQRSFAESYDMEKCRTNFYRGDYSVFPEISTEQVSINKVLDRVVNYPKLDYINNGEIIQSGEITIDESKPKWGDRSLRQISAHSKGFKYDELTECLSDEVSCFEYNKSEQNNGSLQKNNYIIYDFKRTITGFFNLKVNVKKKSTVYIVFDEIFNQENGVNPINPFRNGCCNVVKLKLNPDEYNITTFEANSARFVALILTEGEIEFSEFNLITYENPDIGDFKYDTKDAELNKILDSCKNTLAQNAVDVLTDCPSRERAGWLCDSYFSSKAEYLFTGKNLVEHNFLENYILSPQSEYLPDGMIPMCYPADHINKMYIPNWSMWFILELKNYVIRTGDRKLIDTAKERVYNLIKFFKKYLNEDGLLENLESWVFVEWSKCNDKEHLKGVNYPSNMLYAASLEAAGFLYDDEALVEQAKQMKKVVEKQSYNGKFFEDNRVRQDGMLSKTGHLTETCQYYAFYFGVASKQKYPELFDLLMSQFGPDRNCATVYPDVFPSNAIVGNYLRLELLIRENEYQQTLSEIKKFFLKMAELTGTLWEHNDMQASLNHGFASIAANYIIECCENS